MPIVRIELIEGRAPEVKENLIRRVTDAVTAALAVQPAQVRVLLYELPPEHWAVGGQTKAALAASVPSPNVESGGQSRS